MSVKVRLVLLDDRPERRRESRSRLETHPRLLVIGEASEPLEAARIAENLHADAVLVETRRLDHRGTEALASLSAPASSRAAIIAYLQILHRGDWPAALAAGADDLLLKEMDLDLLASELRTIVERVRREAPWEVRHDTRRLADLRCSTGVASQRRRHVMGDKSPKSTAKSNKQKSQKKDAKATKK